MSAPHPASRWLAYAGAAIYLSLPIFVVYPELFALIARVEPLEGARLANFRSLMFVVSPIGLIYLYGARAPHPSLTDLTVLWRMLWVGPFVLLNVALETLEVGGALFIGSVDLVLPLLALGVEHGQTWARLREHLRHTPASAAHRALATEAILGVTLTLLVAGLAAAQGGYDGSFVIGVIGYYYLFVGWASRADGIGPLLMAAAMRIVLAVSLASARYQGYTGPMLSIFIALLLGGAVASTYTYARSPASFNANSA